MKNSIPFLLLLTIFAATPILQLHARTRSSVKTSRSFTPKRSYGTYKTPRIKCSTRSSRSYTPKGVYAGLGQTSKVTHLPKTKCVSGHVKRTSRGCAYVNPYAKSK